MIFNRTKNTFIITALLVIGLASASVGCKGKKADESKKEEATATQKLEGNSQRGLPNGENDSDIVTVGNSFIKGPADAPITIVEFSDFQCPFCSRGANTLHELLEKYPDKIRVVYKFYPLPFHKQAPAAAHAALAAGEQGKFWEMYHVLFDKQKEFGEHASDMKEWTTGLAKDLGLDTAKFGTDFDAAAKSSTIQDDIKLGSSIGVNGTPAFFINGKLISGAQPLNNFEDAVKTELDLIEKLGGSVAKNDLYKTRVKANYKKAEPPKPPAPVINFVPIDKADPIVGNTKNPLVTIVEFSDFQCPFCSRVNPTIDEIKKNYGKDVRIVFKQNPLSFHQNAEPAARAALAASKQGKFWEMHDKLFENQKDLGQDGIYEKFAKELGVNVKKFKKDFDSDEIKNKVKADVELASKVGARGTPNFFINGVNLVGAQPYPAFEAAIKTQIDVAKKVAADKKLSGDELYKAVVEYNKANAPSPGDSGNDDAPAPTKVDPSKLIIGDSPVKGDKNAKVTIVEFSDFQCPFCSRGTKTLHDVFDQYKGKIKVVFKNYPLPFHQNAEPAARAALAAHKQGKFWEMHDKLFANQQDLGTDGIFEKYAKEIGINVAKFKKDFESDALKKQVQEDMKLGSSVGVNGTPAFFINGQLISGAQPIDNFKAVIDSFLK